eukprot:3032209-Pyramimonas_sp.AAC.1
MGVPGKGSTRGGHPRKVKGHSTIADLGKRLVPRAGDESIYLSARQPPSWGKCLALRGLETTLAPRRGHCGVTAEEPKGVQSTSRLHH